MSNDKQLVKSFLNTLGIGFDEGAIKGSEDGSVSFICGVCGEHSCIGGIWGREFNFWFDENDKFVEIELV